MSNLTVCNHPLVEHKMAILRDERTGHKEFRELVSEITSMMCYESLKDIPTEQVEITTPIERTLATKVKDDCLFVVPILRAGLGMVNGFLSVLPTAHVCHIGMARDEETLQPKEYYAKIPTHAENKLAIVLDPMLATGGSAAAAIEFLKKRGITNIRLMCIVAAPEGVAYLNKQHPDVQIFTAVLDRCLNNKGYIMPGLGDAGDRLFY